MEYDKLLVENIITKLCKTNKVTPLFVVEAGNIMHNFLDLRKMYHSYRGVCYNNYKEYIKDKEEVNLKKLLFVFRNAMCMYRITTGLVLPEVFFTELLSVASDTDGVSKAANTALDMKRLGVINIPTSHTAYEPIVNYIKSRLAIDTDLLEFLKASPAIENMNIILRKHLLD